MRISVDSAEFFCIKKSSSQSIEVEVHYPWIHLCTIDISLEQALAIKEFIEKNVVPYAHAKSGLELK